MSFISPLMAIRRRQERPLAASTGSTSAFQLHFKVSRRAGRDSLDRHVRWASWKRGKLTQYADLAGLTIAALLEDHEGSIWVGALGFPNGKLCEIQKGSIRCYPEIGGLATGVFGLHQERVNERTRIARDLHDTLLQSFQGVLLKFHAVTYRLPDRPEARKELESAIEQARQAIAEGRDAVQGLRSSVVVTNDLARAITTFGEGLASDQNGWKAPDFRVHVEGTSRDLAPVVRDELYRIAGEALRNAFRHAGARRVEVEIHYDARRLRMRVRDDGKGIGPQVPDAGGRSGRHGLPGMLERAELVGGRLAIWSELDSGTEIELTIPSALAYAKAQAIKVGGQSNLMKG